MGIASALKPKLISIMDHTPGARQFTSIDQFKNYYLGKRLISPEKIEAYIEERLEKQNLYAVRNKLAILCLARELGIQIASHDDATLAHVAEAVQELYSRFDTAVMVEATRDSLYITEANTPMIFFRYLPREIDDLPVPF